MSHLRRRPGAGVSIPFDRTPFRVWWPRHRGSASIAQLGQPKYRRKARSCVGLFLIACRARSPPIDATANPLLKMHTGSAQEIKKACGISASLCI